MSYDFKPTREKAEKIKEWLSSEFSSIRTGRAAPQMIEKISVDVYGTKTPIAHLATIALEDRKTLRIAPWDKAHISGMQSAIDRANIGVSTAVDEAGIRVIFPDLTEENRKMTLRIIKERLEDARISLRKERDVAWGNIQKSEKEKEISEDDKFASKEELEKVIHEYTDKFESMATKKEEDILNN